MIMLMHFFIVYITSFALSIFYFLTFDYEKFGGSKEIRREAILFAITPAFNSIIAIILIFKVLERIKSMFYGKE